MISCGNNCQYDFQYGKLRDCTKVIRNFICTYKIFYMLVSIYITYIQVLECGIIKSTVISEVFVPIPEPSVTIANERTENYEFTSIIALPPSFNAVGSGEYSYHHFTVAGQSLIFI